jgi:hypothetical protein
VTDPRLTERWERMVRTRAASPGERLQAVVVDAGNGRRAAVLVACEVAAVALDYVTDDRGTLAHALDVARWWAAREAGGDGLRAARDRAVEVATRTDADGDRCAWLSLQTAVALIDLALEDMVDLAGKRARDLAACALEAMCWPDLDDEEVRAQAVERLHGVLDAAITQGAAPQGPRR